MRMETTGSTPFRFNLHVGDVGHALVLGPIGSGKTTFTCTMAAQWFRYPKAQVFVFDYDYGAWLTTHALGGRHYDLSTQDDLSFCPLQHLSDWEDQAWAAAYIEDLCALNAVAVSPKQKNAISDAVKMIHDSSHRSLTHFCLQVQDEAVKDALRHYTVDGMAGRLLDAEKDTLHLGGNRIVCFECKGLLQSQDKRTPMAVMRYLFRRIEKRLDGSPTLLILDEGHEYLKHELFAGKLDEWLLTLRKRNVAVVVATQQISHVMNSRIASTLIEQCPTKILLPNPECRNPAVSRYYGEHGLGLNERELWMLQRAMPKRDYYVMSSLGKRMANLCMGDVGLAFCSVNAPQDRAAVERLMVAYPETWPSEWLRTRGAAAWADYLARREQRPQCVSA
jgi:type IV secretion/conjugal transfer VirB4 family ATPase